MGAVTALTLYSQRVLCVRPSPGEKKQFCFISDVALNLAFFLWLFYTDKPTKPDKQYRLMFGIISHSFCL